MKSALGKSAGKKTKRVATVFTGVAAMGAAFAPAAQAVPAVPAMPANPIVYVPYTTWVKTSPDVYSIQVCGYHVESEGNAWYCTAKEHNPHFGGSHSNFFGGPWQGGKTNIWVWAGSAHGTEYGHTCNTSTGAYHAVSRIGKNGSAGLSFSAGYHSPIRATGTSEC
jgi:hypothetical protein